MPVINSLIVKKSNTVADKLCIQYGKDANNKITAPTTIIDFDGATDVDGGVFYNAYAFNSSITGNVDLSNFTSLTGSKQVGYYQLGCCDSMFSKCTGITSADLSNVQNIGPYCCEFMFQECTSLASVDLGSLETIGYNSCQYMFDGCTNLTTVDLSSLTTITGPNSGMFGACEKLTSLDLSGLVTVSGERGLQTFFNRCPLLTTVNFDSFTNATGYMACSQMFYNTGLQHVSFPSLSNISGNQAFAQAFEMTYGAEISFPALTSQSFGSYTNQFDDMCRYCSNNIVHFPSNLQSVIGSWPSVVSGFSGTDTTVSFDLPATE